MKLVQNNQLNIGISPMFISLCLQVSQAMKHVNQYQQIKKYRKRTKGKTYQLRRIRSHLNKNIEMPKISYNTDIFQPIQPSSKAT